MTKKYSMGESTKRELKEHAITRKVVCVFGKFDNKSDFVLEPACNSKTCECCKDSFYITKVEKDKLPTQRKKLK